LHPGRPKPSFHAPGTNARTARRLLKRALLLRRVLDEAGVRGWVAVLSDAGATDRERTELVSALKTIWNRARSGVAVIGDDRRAKGSVLGTDKIVR
jgi:hypothetical protein